MWHFTIVYIIKHVLDILTEAEERKQAHSEYLYKKNNSLNIEFIKMRTGENMVSRP